MVIGMHESELRLWRVIRERREELRRWRGDGRGIDGGERRGRGGGGWAWVRNSVARWGVRAKKKPRRELRGS